MNDVAGLAALFRDGEVVEARSTAPVTLDDAQSVWWVAEGEVDVFAVWLRHDVIVARGLVGTSRAGDLLLGGAAMVDGESVALRAVGLPHARLQRIPLQSLRTAAAQQTANGALPAAVDRWLRAVGSCIARRAPVTKVVLLEPGHTVGVEPGCLAFVRYAPVWVKLEQGVSPILGSTSVELRPTDRPLAVTENIWIEPKEKIRLSCADTASALAAESAAESLGDFQRVALLLWLEKAKAEQAEEFQRLRNKALAEARVVGDAIQQLSAVMQPRDARTQPGDGDPLLQAYRLVADDLEVPVNVAASRGASAASLTPLADLARGSRLRLRRVALRRDWWNHSVGPMVGFAKDGNRPVALLPRRHGDGYDVVDPATNSRVQVTSAVAPELVFFASAFYRPLPDHLLKGWDLLKAGLRECRSEARRLALFGVGSSIVGMVVPIATARIISDSIPGGDRVEVLQIGIGLLAATLAAAVFSFSSTVAILRMEGKMEAAVQSGLWDRLLNLPATFFRRFASGDLADRAMGINQMRKMLTDTAIASILSAMFSLFSVALLFYYSGKLAIVALALVLVMCVVTAIVSHRQVEYQRRLYSLSGKIDGLVFQILTGISKLRVAKAEGRAFSVWAGLFASQKQLALRSRMGAIFLDTFNSAFSVVAIVAMFLGFAVLLKGALPPGSFLAFSAAFGAFLAAALGLSHSLISLLQIVPLYERARPVLESQPEVNLSKADPGPLNGEIELSRVFFRYAADGPPIVQDISLRVAPTEFVALAGPSGSGKSTLFRLMLGFESPESGTVSYDGQELSTLDVQAVRRQTGVVLQHGRLFSGDIFHNIVGALPLTVEEAWDAARKAGVAEDIEAMPMGMFTFLSEGGSNISGGQRQRLLIARALAAKPKILFFDEATSALDNRTQAIVSRSLEEMRVTRVVIAHRLSTIRNADRIIVVEGGRLIEMGNYDELMTRGGAFYKVAKRQLV